MFEDVPGKQKCDEEGVSQFLVLAAFPVTEVFSGPAKEGTDDVATA